MKINNLIKSTPLLLTLLLITILSISNQKQYTKLKILIWNTPSLTLGTYIAISTSTGFILSYIITTNLANLNKLTPIRSLKFKEEKKNEEINEYTEVNTEESYDNTLIERDIKDPAPTINASFRIIGRNGRGNGNFINNDKVKYDDSIEYQEKYDGQTQKTESINKEITNSYDWNDDSYSRW